MAIGATFAADFTSIEKGIRGVNVEFRDMTISARQAERAVEKVVNSFDGRKIVTEAQAVVRAVEAIGGASRLTEAEQRRANATVTEALAKYKALGQEAPESLQALKEELGDLDEAHQQGTTSVTDLAKGYIAGIATWETAKAVFAGLVRFIGSSVQEYADAERAQTRLTTALEKQGFATPRVTDAYGDLAAQFQQTTGFAGGLVTEMQGLLVQVGDVMPRDMERALEASANLAAGLGIDLEQATQAVARAAAGNTTALQRFGITIDSARLQAEGLPAVLDAINARFGGQAIAAMDTYEGRVRQVSNAWADLKENIGEAVATNPLVEAALRNLAGQLSNTEEEASGAKSALTELFSGASTVTDPARGVAFALGILADRANEVEDAQERMAGLPSPFERWNEERLAIFNETGRRGLGVFADWVKASDEAAEAAKKHAEAVQTLRQRLSGAELLNDFKKLKQAWDGLTPAERAHALATGAVTAEYEKLAGKLPELPAHLRAFQLQLQVATLEFDSVVGHVFKTQEEIGKKFSSAGFLDDAQARASIAAFARQDAAIRKLRTENEREFRRLTMDSVAFRLDEVQRMVDLEKVQVDRSLSNWRDYFDEIETKGGRAMAEIVEDTDEYRALLLAVGTIFPPLLASLDEWKDKMEGISQTGMTFGQRFRQTFEAAIGDISDIIIQGLINGARGEEIAVAVGSRLGAALGGSIGYSIGGPLGQAIGESLGSLVGPAIDAIYRSRAEKTVERVAYEFGVGISEEFAQGIEDEAKRRFGGNRQAAKIFNLQGIIQEGGGLDSHNIRQLQNRLRDVFVMYETGAFDAAEAQQVLNENFGTFAEFVTRNGGRITEQLREIIRLNDATGLQSSAIAEFTSGQARNALGSIGSFVETLDVVKLTKGGAQALGASLFGVFERLTRNGADARDVLLEIDPLIAELDAHLKAAGLSGGAAFRELRSMAALATDEITGPHLQAIDALGASLDFLHNSDILTPEMFSGITDQIGATIEALKKQGKTSQEIYPFIADDLQRIWELQREHGYAVDATVQAMLDEAEAAGVIGEEHRSVEERMLLATERMATALEGLAEHFGVLLPGAVDEFGRALDGLPDKVTVDGEFNWENPDAPRGAPPGERGDELPSRRGGSPGLMPEDWGAGTQVVLHGMETVVRAGDEAAFARAHGVDGGQASIVFHDGAIRVALPPGSGPEQARAFLRALRHEIKRGGDALADARDFVAVASQR